MRMGLVDYSSDSSESEETTGPRTKKQKTSSDTQKATNPNSSVKSELPPLPSAFHDLYASTVRVSASDDPTLHQGRKRVNPHKVGNWPSHLYIEWHPTPTEQTTLTTLLSSLQSKLTSSSSPSIPTTITSFLTSDLGAPQPLHISLSRPIVLSTAQKDTFPSSLESSIQHSGIAPFELAPLGLEWHRTTESARSFLVLRVGPPGTETRATTTPDDLRVRKTAKAAAKSRAGETENRNPAATNPQLVTLLRRANTLVTAAGQPALYAFADSSTSATQRGASAADENEESSSPNTDVNKAFHISIAWSFAGASAELRRLTSEAFHSTAHIPNHSRHDADESSRVPSHNGGEDPPPATFADAVAAMRVRVDGVKAKIGNVVTHVALPDPRGRTAGRGGGGLFGV
ncbi:U6 snRNA phosphodiesterase Usb1 [Hypoxylon argillaceum]|nr:U6 snRNA phosphodiesterase Usb1 [Hypoxylon argillaceum]